LKRELIMMKIGFRPIIDVRESKQDVREGLEAQTMGMAKLAVALIATVGCGMIKRIGAAARISVRSQGMASTSA
jgi:hypothetical protein